MMTTVTYDPTELKRGKCTCCGERSSQIVKDDGRCVDCIEEAMFIETVEQQFRKYDTENYEDENLDEWE